MRMFRTGLNPYGLTYTLGLQGANGPRANPRGRGLEGLLQIAEEIGARSIEIHNAWLVPLGEDKLFAPREQLDSRRVEPIISHGIPWEPPGPAARTAVALGAWIIWTPLTPVLCGDRSARADEVADVRMIGAREAAHLGPHGSARGLDDRDREPPGRRQPMGGSRCFRGEHAAS